MQNNNKVTLIGYVGNHLELKKLESGNKIVNLRVATHFEKRNEKNQGRLVTTWHDVIAWNGVATYAEYSFVKGSRILVEGMLVYHDYTDSNGHTHHVVQIRANSLTNLDR